MTKKVLTEDDVFKILKKFTMECVHGGDFDQGNTKEDTLSILKNWWNNNKVEFKIEENPVCVHHNNCNQRFGTSWICHQKMNCFE